FLMQETKHCVACDDGVAPIRWSPTGWTRELITSNLPIQFPINARGRGRRADLRGNGGGSKRASVRGFESHLLRHLVHRSTCAAARSRCGAYRRVSPFILPSAASASRRVSHVIHPLRPR